ncbi:WD40-repeat-containing domain protein [Irpex lacteus]|nr:WD40-repeat-containing domain protein [Irpex lacteus]
MSSRYREAFRLEGRHPKSISCLAFSPNMTLLASGGIDGKICIWAVDSQDLLYSCTSKTSSSVLCCIWKEGRNDSILCGLGDGTIAEVTFSESKVSLVGIAAHDYPVEKLAMALGYLVSGAQRQLSVWRYNGDERWIRSTQLETPETKKGRPKEVLVTGLSFTQMNENLAALLVTYMHHGIMLYNASDWTLIKQIPYNGTIGSCDVHPDASLLAISNYGEGVDLYSLKGAESRHLFQDARAEHPIPAVFAQDGHGIVTGTETGGDCYLWGTASQKCIQKLSTGKNSRVLAVTACRTFNEDNREADCFDCRDGTFS